MDALREVHVSKIEEARADVDRLRKLLAEGSARALSDLDRGCRVFAERWFGPAELASAVRALVEGDGYILTWPADVPRPILGGPTASTAEAYFSGASWGTGTAAQYNAWLRDRERLFGAPRVEERRARRLEKFRFSKEA